MSPRPSFSLKMIPWFKIFMKITTMKQKHLLRKSTLKMAQIKRRRQSIARKILTKMMELEGIWRRPRIQKILHNYQVAWRNRIPGAGLPKAIELQPWNQKQGKAPKTWALKQMQSIKLTATSTWARSKSTWCMTVLDILHETERNNQRARRLSTMSHWTKVKIELTKGRRVPREMTKCPSRG